MPEIFTSAATIAEIVGGIAVLGGVAFGLLQLHQYRRQRSDQAAIELMRSMMTPHFTKTYNLLHELPEGLGAAALKARGDEYTEAAFSIATIYETLGYMVYRGVLPIEFVDDLLGGVAMSTWRKVGPYYQEIRETVAGQELIVEWYQWLIDRLEERGPAGSRPPPSSSTTTGHRPKFDRVGQNWLSLKPIQSRMRTHRTYPNRTCFEVTCQPNRLIWVYSR